MRSIVKDFVNTKNSLDNSINAAGGIELTFSELSKMTALDLIDLISTNNIIFKYVGERVSDEKI